MIGVLVFEAIDEVHFGGDGPLGAGGGGLDLLDDVGGAAGVVGFFDDLEPALRMHHHFDVRVFRASLIDVLGTE